jgi:SAM-dependent methyltransferase
VAGGEWESEAENWVRWARTPEHDHYWYYRDDFFDRLIPPAGHRTVEIGCGEGRVTRDLAAHGHCAIGVDPSPTLVRYARQASTDTSYALADGVVLPFPDGVFDLAVAYNSLQVVADMPGTVAEAARVLCRGSRFCFCVSHPATDMGRFLGDEPDASFAVRQGYFTSRRVDDTVESRGLPMTFRGWTYTLEDYAVALENVGLRIETMREPRPSGDLDWLQKWHQVPLFLMVRTIKT